MTKQPTRSTSRGKASIGTSSSANLLGSVVDRTEKESGLPTFGALNLGNQTKEGKSSTMNFTSEPQKKSFDIAITIQASGGSRDTAMCHRFINFETSDRIMPE